MPVGWKQKSTAVHKRSHRAPSPMAHRFAENSCPETCEFVRVAISPNGHLPSVSAHNAEGAIINNQAATYTALTRAKAYRPAQEFCFHIPLALDSIVVVPSLQLSSRECLTLSQSSLSSTAPTRTASTSRLATTTVCLSSSTASPMTSLIEP